MALHGGGFTGYGQMRPVNPFQGETAASVVAALRDFYAPALLGLSLIHISEPTRPY